MKTILFTQDPKDYKGDIIVYFLTQEQLSLIDKLPLDKNAANIAKKDFTGEFLKTFFTHLHTITPRILLVGLGEEKNFNCENVRKASSIAISFAKQSNLENIALVVPSIKQNSCFEAVAEGSILTTYNFDKYKTEEKQKKKPIKEISFVIQKEKAKETELILKKIDVICNSVFFVRDLVNENADIMNTTEFVEAAKKVAYEKKLKITVLDQKQIKKLGLNLHYSVGQGSKYPSYLVFLEYNGNPPSREKVALIGKGITFDTGGLNLKPSGIIETMREDMAGAATVLGIAKMAAELKIKKNIVAVLALAENAIGNESFKPGDVLTSYSGLTVEIANTDAEGRLVLADAINYTIKNYKPDLVIDFATLTGAIVVALGHEAAGIFGTASQEIEKLKEIGEGIHDRVWEMPLYDEYAEDLKSEIADIKNLGIKGSAGSITGALFIKKFVGETPWIHLDIAGVAFYDDKPRFYNSKSGTGNCVRLFAKYLED